MSSQTCRAARVGSGAKQELSSLGPGGLGKSLGGCAGGPVVHKFYCTVLYIFTPQTWVKPGSGPWKSALKLNLWAAGGRGRGSVTASDAAQGSPRRSDACVLLRAAACFCGAALIDNAT